MGDAAETVTGATERFEFQAEVNQVLSLVINSLYSNREIFLRELVSNASDALDKLRYRKLTEHDLGDAPAEIRIVGDEAAKTLTIEDFGAGMTRDQLIGELGTIAHSGTRAFLEKLQENQEKAKQGDEDLTLIGQFGVGFYSAYLVADQVTVVTRPAGGETAWKWSSDAANGFTIESAERAEPGTAIILHLKEDCLEYARPFRLRELIGNYSDYVNYPIKLREERTPPADPEAADDAPAPEPVVEFNQVNSGKALWQKSKSDLKDEDYADFYKQRFHDWEEPLTHAHFKVEGAQLFTGLVFVPNRAPFDLYTMHQRRGVRLYVKRVFIMDDADALVPQWLRFIKGIIDSDDLPLNVSRELLQDSAVTRVIRKQLVKKTLDMLLKLAGDDAEKYQKFWETFGPVLKEGLHFEPTYKDKLGKLLRYRSTASDGEWTSLEAYRERMAEDQEAIYYAIGASEDAIVASPHLEALRAKGYEVLLMADPIDEWAVQGLGEFDGKPLVSAMKADLDLNSDAEEDSEAADAKVEELQPLLDRARDVLGDRIGDVRPSKRLTESPACLAIADGGVNAQLEKLMRASGQQLPMPKRVFELNADHALVKRLVTMHASNAESDEVAEFIELLYDQSLVTEGSAIADPQAFAKRLTRLMLSAAN